SLKLLSIPAPAPDGQLGKSGHASPLPANPLLHLIRASVEGVSSSNSMLAFSGLNSEHQNHRDRPLIGDWRWMQDKAGLAGGVVENLKRDAEVPGVGSAERCHHRPQLNPPEAVAHGVEGVAVHIN